MRLLFLQNDLGSPAGVLLEEAEAHGAQCSVVIPYQGISRDPDLPGRVPDSPDGFDGIVVLGGVMSVNDEARYPFIEETRALLRRHF